MKRITSKDNPDFRRVWRLAHLARERRDARCTVLDGVHLVQAYAEAHGLEHAEVVLAESSSENPEIQDLLRTERPRAVLLLTDKLVEAASPVEAPTGILAVVPIPLPGPSKQRSEGFIVLLDGIQDPGNLGSILRSAAAAGAAEAWASADCADPWSPKCLRGGMGAQFRLAVRDHVDLATAAARFNQRLIAADVDAEQPLFGTDLSGPIAFVVGAEGAGISPALLSQVQARVRIPMEPGIESLNAAAAAAVLFYEWRRQRDEKR